VRPSPDDRIGLSTSAYATTETYRARDPEHSRAPPFRARHRCLRPSVVLNRSQTGCRPRHTWLRVRRESRAEAAHALGAQGHNLKSVTLASPRRWGEPGRNQAPAEPLR